VALKISNLDVDIEGKRVLSDLSIAMEPGEVHVIMGPNGAGKTTLSKALSGDPALERVTGHFSLHGQDLLPLSPEERVWKGLFVGFQHPVEIVGVTLRKFLSLIVHAKRKALGEEPLSTLTFEELLAQACARVQMPLSLLDRCVNKGFSGGEKKRSEWLQMLLLSPDFILLDEPDSGVDIDALRILASLIEEARRAGKMILVITHYQRLLEYFRPDAVHLLINGKLVASGGHELSIKIEASGYAPWSS